MSYQVAFDPKTFIDVSKTLLSGTTEAHYRSIANRAYYGAFGYIRSKLAIYVDDGSVHREVIQTLKRSESLNHKKVGTRLETLFKKRKDADYKHQEEFKKHFCQFCINEAEELIALFDNDAEAAI